MKSANVCSPVACIFSLVLSLTLAGCNTPDATPSPLTLGIILPMDESSGPLRKNAAQTAVDEINEAGGISGDYVLQLDVRSSAGDNREIAAAAAANDLLASNAKLIGFVTAFSSSSKGVALHVADPKHIPQISGSSTTDSNSGLSPYFQRLAPRDDVQALALARKALAAGIQTVSIAIQQGDAFGEGVATVFRTEFTSLGGTVLDAVHFVANDPAYKTKLTQLYKGAPDAVFIAMVATDVEFLNQVDQSEIGLNKKALRFLLSDAQKRDDILNKAPAYLLTGDMNNHPKSFGAVTAPNPASPAFKNFTAELKTRYNQDVASFNAQFYDSVYLFALAAEQAARSVSPDEIDAFREAINANLRPASRPDTGDSVVAPNTGWTAIKAAAAAGSVNYEGASGNCDINQTGDVVTQYEIFKVIQNAANAFEFKTVEYLDPTATP